MVGIFGEFSVVSVSKETKHDENRQKNRENSEESSGESWRRIFQKSWELSFCNFSDQTICDGRVLYGAGAETLIFVTGTPGEILSPGRKTKISGVYPENQEE